MIRLIAFAWILGIALLGHTHPQLYILTYWFWFILAVLAPLAYLLLWYFNQLHRQYFLKWILRILASLAFLALGYQFSDAQLEQRLAIEVKQNQTVEGIVYIDQISEGKTENWRQTAQLLIPQQNRTIQVLLYPKRIYDPQGEIIGFTTDQFELGQFYQATLEIKPPHGYANEGGFDQEKWLLQENIQATAIVRFSQPMTAQQITAMGWHQFVSDQLSLLKRWQLYVEKLRLAYRNHLLAEPTQLSKGLLLGLLTGDRSGIDKETTLLYQQMGISHLLAISGPHVLILASLVTGALMWLMHVLMRRGKYSQLYLHVAKQRFYLPIFIILVTFYLAFTGFEIPALRTWWMVLLVSICLWMRWQISTFTLMLSVASIVLFIDCFSILSAAFWLSFGASAILLMIYQQIQQQESDGYESLINQLKRIIGLLWQSQWRIFIALLPIVLWQFKAVSLISPLINLIAIPFLSVLIVPLDIVAALMWQIIPPIGNLLWWFAASLLSVFNGILHVLQPLAQLLYVPSQLSFTALVSFSIALSILAIPQGLIHRIWVIIFLIPILLPNKSTLLQVDILDVGQGQAIAVRTDRHTMLVDAGMGSWQNAQPTLGDRVIVPFLRSQGISKIDELQLSHLDLDHSGGANAVLQNLNVKLMRSNVIDRDNFEMGNLPFLRCSQGQDWQWDQVSFQILWPLEQDLRRNANESSCVMLIEAPMQGQKFKILLMGDVGWEAEYQLLQLYPDLQADILILGHHGSKYSSAYDFLKKIRPKLAISSTGIDNRYKHPTPETLARLADLGIAHLDTTTTGQLHIHLQDSTSYWQVSAYRQQRKWLLSTRTLPLLNITN